MTTTAIPTYPRGHRRDAPRPRPAPIAGPRAFVLAGACSLLLWGALLAVAPLP